MEYVSVTEMQAIEREANASGFLYAEMMEHAGHNLADVLLEQYGYLAEDGVLGLVGSGNNGGDTLVALDYLAQEGWKASAAILRSRPADDPLVQRVVRAGGQVYWLDQAPQVEERLAQLLDNHGLVLDGVLGTGARLPLKPDLAAVLGFVRQYLEGMQSPPAVVAVDTPSGVDCDSGAAASECIPAERTVTMAAIKHGLFKFPAYRLAGKIDVVGIGLPEDGRRLAAWQAVQCFVPDLEWVQGVLPARPPDAHKGTFGTTLVVAGSTSYTGAAWLSGQAAYRSGAGLVTLAVPEPLHAALAGQFPEATWVLLPHENGFIAGPASEAVHKSLPRATSLLVGPGFGVEDCSRVFLERLFETPCNERPPLTLDADGLKLARRLPGWPDCLLGWSDGQPQPAVLTPHPGEFSILTGLSKEEIQANRLDLARRYSQEWGHVVVLKGAFTIVAAPGGQAAIIPVASAALARAGTGDVLAGLIAGLRAQGVGAFPAAVAGAWMHAMAGLLAARKLGHSAAVLAGDVLTAMVEVLADVG